MWKRSRRDMAIGLSMVLPWAAGDFALAVDYSKASGADALLVSVGGSAPRADAKGGEKVKVQTVTAGKTTFNVMTLAADGRHPEVTADGDGLAVGKQTLKFIDGRLTLSTFAPAKDVVAARIDVSMLDKFKEAA